MSGETNLMISGNLTSNPKPGATRAGARFAKLRVASTARHFDRTENQWRDGETIFLDVTCWRRLAENVLASLERGDRVLVTGRLRQRSYEDAQGTKHTVMDMEADAVAPDLSRSAANLVRSSGVRNAEEPEPVSDDSAEPVAEIATGIAA